MPAGAAAAALRAFRESATKKIQPNVPGSPTSGSIELQSEEGRRAPAEAPRWLQDFPHPLGMKQILGDLGAETRMYGNPEGPRRQSKLQERAPFFFMKKTTNGYFVFHLLAHCAAGGGRLVAAFLFFFFL